MMIMKFFRRNKEKGFTLVELLVSMTIAMIVLAAVSNSFISQSKAFNAQEQINEMQQNARAAMDLMVREIKMAGYDPAATGVAAIVTVGASDFRFRADFDGSGDLTTGTNDVRYFHDADNDQILRSLSGGAAVAIAENITDSTFQYFDADRDETADPAQIRQILVTITAQTDKVDPNTGEYRTYTATSWVTPNNLGY